jgi:tRNA threonylcarbamoyladenosine biosynthesis protein TsaB
MATLVLEASTYTGSVAVLDGQRVCAVREVAMRGEREERLMPAAAAALAEAGVAPGGLTRVVCGAGPGSFTSLRIAASIAKGLAMSSGAELWAASSLALLVADAGGEGRVVASLDAMRGESFVQPFESMGGNPRPLAAVQRVPQGARAELVREWNARLLASDGVPPHVPHARGVARLEEGELLHRVDLASWEPDYGRLAEAQVQWERAHGRKLVVDG